MKKILFVFVAMLLMFACGDKTPKQTEVTNDSIVVDSTMIDTISIN